MAVNTNVLPDPKLNVLHGTSNVDNPRSEAIATFDVRFGNG